MTSVDLSEWALKHRSFMWFLMIVSAIAGVMADDSLCREKDPTFTIKTMVVQQVWPGATVEETLDQVTEDSLRALNLRVSERFFRLADVATITRTYKDLPDPLFRIEANSKSRAAPRPHAVKPA